MEKGFPISTDRAIFLADAHLNQDDNDSRNFLALADRAASERIPLFLLGDIFDLWFGAPEFAFAFQKPIVEHLQALRQRLCFCDVLEKISGLLAEERTDRADGFNSTGHSDFDLAALNFRGDSGGSFES